MSRKFVQRPRKLSIRESISTHREYLKDLKVARLDTLAKERSEIKSKLGHIAETRENFHERQDLLLELARIDEEDTFYNSDKHVEEFVELVQPLLKPPTVSNKEQRSIIHHNIFNHDNDVPSFVEKESCEVCHTDFLVRPSDSMLICPKCGKSETVIYYAPEYIDQTENKHNQYERGPLYRKYISQFHVDAPEIPLEVIRTIKKHMTKIHMLLPGKVKQTPVMDILRNENYRKWVPSAVRIARHINGEVEIKFDQDLIDRLVYRFNKITSVFDAAKMQNRKKIMNFEFLTHQFLYMENRSDLAEWFSCLKTRKVLKQAEIRFKRCCMILQKTDELNWVPVRNT